MINEHFATIIVSIVTGIVSIVTIWIQKNNSKIIKTINKQTSFMEKENELKSKIDMVKQEMEKTIYNIQMLILDTNIEVLNGTTDSEEIKLLSEKAVELKQNLNKYNEEFEELMKEYNMVLEYNKMLQSELESSSKKIDKD